jgi:hypothetical protein
MRSERIGDEDRIQNTDRKVEFVESTLQTPRSRWQSWDPAICWSRRHRAPSRKRAWQHCLPSWTYQKTASERKYRSRSRNVPKSLDVARKLLVTDVDLVCDDIYRQEKKKRTAGD